MSTRAASAAYNLEAKKELVKLLFGKQYHRKGPMAHRMLDHSIYTYEDLRVAYLKKVQEIHPDKHHRQVTGQTRNEHQQQFIQLQEAWNRFEELAKVMRTVNNNNRTSNSNGEISIDSNFTLFGVGCSFADSEQERILRNKFMDEACRGWVSAGALAHDSFVDDSTDSNDSSTYDPLFVQDADEDAGDDTSETETTNDGERRKQPAMEFLRRSQQR